MEPTEDENVEYHIEIQKCEEGPNAGTGEVMYVLDLGGADIPENIAMQLAQLAADGSLNLGEGTSSIMVQNESNNSNAQILQIDKDGLLMGPTESVAQHSQSQTQLIQLEMDGSNEYLTAELPVSLDPSVTTLNFGDDVFSMDKCIMGKSKSRGQSNTVSLLNRVGKIDRIAKAGGARSRMSSLLQGVNTNQSATNFNKTIRAMTETEIKDKKSKGDKLSIYPYLKGKTPVMLIVSDDGKFVQEGGEPMVLNAESSKKAVTASDVDTKAGTSLSNITTTIPSINNQPIILDYNMEKNKLDLLLAGKESASGESKAEYENKNKEVNAEEAQSKSIAPPVNSSERDEELPSNVDNKSTESQSKDQDSNMNADSTMNAHSILTADSTLTAIDGKELEDLIDMEAMDTSNINNESFQFQEPYDEKLKETISEAEEASSCIDRRKCEYNQCEFESSNFLAYAEHLESVHDSCKPFVCFECDKHFKLKLSLIIHELIHKKDAKPSKVKRGPYGARDKFYECPLCSKKKRLKNEIHIHAKTEHELEKSSVFTCEGCKFVSYSYEELQSHFESVSHSTDRRFYCELCNQSFSNLYQHKTSVHTDARPFVCHQCGYAAKTKSSLRYHMVTHLQTKDWACHKCPYKSTSERRLKRHMKTHDPNKKYKCSHCNFATHDSYEYKRHFSKVHGRVKSYKCKFCDQAFKKHHEIRLHLMFEHECNDAFFCSYCEFTCATRAEYKEHIQVHYGKNKHVCEICGFTGRYRTHYRRHMLTHTANKPFTCKICFKSVREASNLRRHMLTHTEEKPLACSVCGYRCKIRSRLMNHMKTHSELRPFACTLCKYTTKFNGNLMKHLENHAHYKPNKCPYCTYACNERNKLRRHMNFRHKEFMSLEMEPKKESEDGVELKSEPGKEIVMLPTQEQYLFVTKDELRKIVAMDENQAVLNTDSGTIVIAPENQEMADQVLGTHDGQQPSAGMGDEDNRVVLKDRTILATLDLDGKNVETLLTLKEEDSVHS